MSGPEKTGLRPESRYRRMRPHMEIAFKRNQVIEARSLWISMVPEPMTDILLKEKLGRRQT